MTEEAGEEAAAAEASELLGKCTRQNALIVVLKPRYLSNLTRTDRFTVENAFLNTGNPDKTDTKYYLLTESASTFISFRFFKNRPTSKYIF
jgi:hypothetical protein